MQDRAGGTDAAPTPFLSVVTVVRNNLDGLTKTREALMRQIDADWEWVIVDGNSTDGTRDFALSCAGGPVKAISEPDRGIYDAMNKGCRLASGRYVVFMNGGDVPAADTTFAALRAELEAQPADVLFGGSVMAFGILAIPRPAKDPAYIWHGQPGLHQATVFDRAQALRFPYDISYRVCGDYDVITRMAAAGLALRSTALLVSINEFVAEATSGRRKMQLIREAVRAQRANLHLSPPRIAASVSLRIANSAAAKLLTYVDALRRRRTA